MPTSSRTIGCCCRSTIFLNEGALREHMVLCNRGADEVPPTLSLAFASDFADIFEVRGSRHNRRGNACSRLLGAGPFVLYRGLNGALRETALSFELAPALQMQSVATYIRCTSRRRQTIFVTASCRGLLRSSSHTFFQAKGFIASHRERRTAMRLVAGVETSNDARNEILSTLPC